MKTLRRINRQILEILSFKETSENKTYDSIMFIASTLKADVFLLYDDFTTLFQSKNIENNNLYEKFSNLDIQRENVKIDDLYYIASPLIYSNECLGYLIFARQTPFDDEEIISFESFKILATTRLFDISRDKNHTKQREIGIVKSSITSFSYSELHAISAIFNELDGDEGIVVASYVSKKYSVTRSVIVSALRKFESSGVIESRSLGAKGTYIKVLNPYLLGELEPIKADFLKNE